MMSKAQSWCRGGRKVRSAFLGVAAASLLLTVAGLPALAWGPHSEITRAALDVLPERERWVAALGAENLEALTRHCWMPDFRGQETPEYYMDDYLLIRALPTHVGHIAPEVKKSFVPHFKRSLQALRTETPVNACRQIGPLVHFVEDLGAPPHTAPRIPNHEQMENWLKASEINISGYRPQLLGRTDEEALAGLLKQADALQAYSAERAALAAPLVKAGPAERPKVEPILLESANESARVAADLLYTLFALGLGSAGGGAIEGHVVAPPCPGAADKGARVVLLDNVLYQERQMQGRRDGQLVSCATDFTTLATTAAVQPGDTRWRGEFRFHNLPDGTYRVLACRPGAQWAVSEPVTVRRGRTAKVQVSLGATDPAGNILQNPDASLAYLPNNLADRWSRGAAPDKKIVKDQVWLSARMRVEPGLTYRCGAVLKDQTAQVRFWVLRRDPKDPKGKAFLVEHNALPAAANGKAEISLSSRVPALLIATVEPTRPLTDLIDRVWVVPECVEPAGQTK